ncbi:DUF2283 domain-containing protein [Candidatus Aerophobetes bacterium]|nr:DUF2283 domain-containing protein [Candidatus Aerophobetes bacterium]
MKIRYVKDIDILDIELQKGKFEYSEELAEGIVLDIGKEGKILSIEVIDASKRLRENTVKKITDKYFTPRQALSH